jgi:hypothetical protein
MANRLWEEFERLDVADERAIRAFCRKRRLVHYDESDMTPLFGPYVDEEGNLEPLAVKEVRHYHSGLVEAAAHARQFTVAIHRGEKAEARRLARQIRGDSVGFFTFTSPVVTVAVRDDLPVLDLGVMPDNAHGLAFEKRLEDCVTFGAIYHDLLQDVLKGQPVLACAMCRHHFVASRRQASVALRKRTPARAYCQDCKSNVGDYELRAPKRREYMRSYMRRRRRRLPQHRVRGENTR